MQEHGLIPNHLGIPIEDFWAIGKEKRVMKPVLNLGAWRHLHGAAGGALSGCRRSIGRRTLMAELL